MMRTAYFLLPLVVVFSTAAHGQIYKWTDSTGLVHYTDQPPATAQAVPLSLEAASAPSSGTAASSGGWQAQEKALDKHLAAKKAAHDRQAKEEAQKQTERANCAQAQGTLRTLQAGGRIATVNAQGEREFMDDQARVAAIATAQQSVAQWCH
ncbi:MAG: DUF4124 domain-containing protein [Betaproteobacteria bacterium]|nr:DUF4124 domain-containing protein [Betaproteobacteria bacterium]